MLKKFKHPFYKKLVEIVIDFKVETSFEDQERLNTKVEPIIISGYLLNADNNFYYFGDDTIRITKAVEKTRVIYLQEVVTRNLNEEILEKMNVPTRNEDIN